MGVDLIWIGVLLGLNLQTSFLTPPFGFSLFYLKGVAPASVTTSQIYRGIIPFILIQLIVLGIYIFIIIITVFKLNQGFCGFFLIKLNQKFFGNY